MAGLLGATALLVTGCPNPAPALPGIPSTFVRVSPDDGGSYSAPVISGDGDVVIYRPWSSPDVAPPTSLLYRTRLTSNVTQTFPNVGSVRALSAHGRYVVHGVSTYPCDVPSTNNFVLDLDTSNAVALAASPCDASAFQVSDGGTVAWLERSVLPDHPTGRLMIQRLGHDALEIEIPPVLQLQGREINAPIALSADGTSVLLYVADTGLFTRYDTTTGDVAPVSFVTSGPITGGAMTWAAPDLNTVELMLPGGSQRLHLTAPSETIPTVASWVVGISRNGDWGTSYSDEVQGPIPPRGEPLLDRTFELVDRNQRTTAAVMTSTNSGGLHAAMGWVPADNGRVAVAWTNSAAGNSPSAPWVIYVVG